MTRLLSRAIGQAVGAKRAIGQAVGAKLASTFVYLLCDTRAVLDVYST